MPTYDYKCEDCKEIREVLVERPDHLQVLCEECFGVMNQQFPGPNLVGMTKFGWKFNEGLGKKYYSSKEMDSDLKAKGIHPV